MNEGPHISSEQLARFVSGEADAAERSAVEQWAAAAPENRRELEAMRSAWELGSTGSALPDVDVDAAWARVQERMHEGSRVIPITRRVNVTRWLAAAAVIAGLFFAVRLVFAPRTQDLVAIAEHVSATLDDSSTVVLSPGSEVKARMGSERAIALRGEAYFEVKRDEQRPFIVDAGAVQVMVLGTGFEVSAYDTSASVLVRVRHGRVRVVAAADTIVLIAGGYARYDKEYHFLERAVAPPMEIWGERIIQFDRAPLAEVAEQLEKIFHVRIELANDAMRHCQLTASFDNETIETVLRVISDTFGLRVESPEGGRYILEGDGC